ncbi:hypothetical protein L3X38_028366 [Prunus dulcis]|uniref:ARID domain-containing protein n=1 Tax=Prunus dulcis TaxID=3755 RepID=A0AAD4VR72_PRUDU|nr:hypothetical protein L3X38_028366 [Prunus dulcis]
MAGWSSLTPGSVLDCVETNDAYQKNGSCIGSDIDVRDGVECDEDDDEVRLRCTFDQVLSVFVKEIGDRGVVRPIPAVIDDRQPVDLFKLFCLVRDRGGYDWVSKNSLWSFVAKELGLDSGATASVKLIYFKYLNELEKWFRESCKSRSSGNGQSGLYGEFQLLSSELEIEFRDLLLDRPEQKEKGDGPVQFESDENGKIEFNLSDTKDAYGMHAGADQCKDDDDEKVCNDDQNGVLISLDSLNKKENDRKRKRESLSGMLNWVVQIAKQPNDPSIGVIPGPTNWREHKGDECWFQVIRAREALLLRRNVDSKTEESLLQKKLKTHPLLYEDNVVAGHQSSERLRCSERFPNSVKSRSCPCCSSCSVPQSNLISPRKKELDNNSKEQAPEEVDLLATNTMVCPSVDAPHEKHVSVGTLFQADVPEWTGVASESDIKWLGTRVWPLQYEKDSSLHEADLTGKGRPDLCGCQLPGSVVCIRFHIAEARMKLKRELGSLFYRWRFDRMGEEVSLQWTAEEEKRFKDLVKSNSPSFWNRASRWFRKKTRENLVSYYFNVFLVQSRSYQNRVTPKNIDSDDDETEFGSFSNGFRNDAVEVSANFVACSQNQQCPDLD